MLVTVTEHTPDALVVQLAADTVEPAADVRLKLAPGTRLLPASRAVTVQVLLLAAATEAGEQASDELAADAPPIRVNVACAVLLLPALSAVVSVGLEPMAPAVPVQVTDVDVAGSGLQVAPGIVLVEPTSTLLQVTVMDALATPLVGLAEQLGAAGLTVSITYAGVAVLLSPPGRLTVAVGPAATEVSELAVQTTLPPVEVAGTQVVPGMLTLSPFAMLVQVKTTAVVWLDGLGLAVHTGAAGAPSWV